MPRIQQYPDKLEELLHPFWLGLIMLLAIIAVIGMLCCIRKSYGSKLRHCFNRLRGRNDLNDECHLNAIKHLPITNPYNWGLTYAPPASSSPKMYKLVRRMQAVSIDKEFALEDTHFNEDNNTTANEIRPITDESDRAKPSPSQSHGIRNSEAARKFYASMRYTSQHVNSSSIDSANNEPGVFSNNQSMKRKRFHKLNFLRTPHFFQSITRA